MHNRLFVRKFDNGNLVFSKGHKKGEKIIESTGKIFNYYDIKLHSHEDEHCFQVGKRMYIGPSGGIDDFVNHSCEPNCGIKKITGNIF